MLMTLMIVICHKSKKEEYDSSYNTTKTLTHTKKVIKNVIDVRISPGKRFAK